MRTSNARKNGAVLVFALLVLVVGGTILGGIAQLAVTQSLAGRAEWDAAARRIRLENSRALARQYILSQVWRGFGGLSQGSLANSVTGGLGGFAITNVDPPAGYWLSLAQNGDERINPFNLFERGGFQSAWARGFLRAQSDDSTNNTVPWGFQVRTRSPITAGFAFVNQRPASNAWTPVRRIDMREADYAVGFSDLPRIPVSSVTNTNTGDTNGFRGFLLLPKAEAGFTNIYTDVTGVNFYTNSATSARAEIELRDFSHGSSSDDQPHFYEVPNAVDVSTNYNCRVTELVLFNSGGSGVSVPLQIVIPSGNTNTARVILRGDNSRAVYLYRQGASTNLVIGTETGNPQWRVGMSLDCDASFDIAGQLTIEGGIRTGKRLSQGSGNTPVFVSEQNPSFKYDAIADRMMWLEDQRAR